MARRKVRLQEEYFYHIFNRGIEQREIFLSKEDYGYFQSALKHYLFWPHLKFSVTRRLLRAGGVTKEQLRLEKTESPWVDVINFCLVPNHFHFTLKQNTKEGIRQFMQYLGNSYSHYFNIKYERSGGLFESRFKAVLVETEAQLFHLSRYIHLQPYTSGIVTSLKDLENYMYSSFPEYLGGVKEEVCAKDIILGNFKTKEGYKQFVFDNASYQKELEKIKHVLLE